MTLELNPILEYLQKTRTNRRSPWEFEVVFIDYTHVHIEDLYKFEMFTLRKELIGVAICMPGEGWMPYFLNPTGGTVTTSPMWKKKQAIEFIQTRHFELVRRCEQIQIRKEVVSDVRNYANPTP